jgi:HK97 family phage prohead protease
VTATLHRAFAADITQRDGREVFGRIVPYNQPARVAADPPGLRWAIDRPYVEQFEFGAMKRAAKAPDRVMLAGEHEGAESLLTQLGYGREITEEQDGAYGVFRVFKTVDGDKALELVDGGVWRAFSLGFLPMVAPKMTADGVVTRTQVHVSECSLCREGAYKGAEVHGRRTLPDLPPEPTAWGLADRLKAVGVQLD